MRGAIDASGEAAHDGESLGREFHSEAMGHPQAGLACGPRTHDSEASGLMERGRSPHEEVGRRIRDFAKANRIVLIGPFQQACAKPWQLAKLLFERVEVAELLDASGRWARPPR